MPVQRDVVVRQASEADASGLARLLELFNGGSVDADTAARRLVALEGIETVFLAFRDGTPVGLSSIRIPPNLSEDVPYAELTELFVLPEHRRQGIGSLLMAAAEELARSKKATSIILLTGFKNATAQSFYRQVGYTDYALAMWRELP